MHTTNKNKIFVFGNDDKDSWQKEQDAKTSIGIRRGSRILLSGGCNTGKSNLLKYLIATSDPPYDKIFIKIANNKSKEFDNINFTRIDTYDDLPSEEDIDELRGRKVLIIFEDTNKINKYGMAKIEPFFSFYASHYGFSCVVVSQTPYALPIDIRRMCDIFFMFGGSCTRFLNSIPIPDDHKKKLKNIITHADQHDFIKCDTGSQEKYFFNNDLLNINKL